jgi:cell wall-associated NlpC family hydrolase
LLAGLAFGILALGIAAAVMLTGPSHRNRLSDAHKLTATLPASSHEGKPHSADTSTGTQSHAQSITKGPTHAAEAASGGTSSAAASSPGTHRLVAEARDPEEAKSFPAPASVHHSAAKAPRAAGELQVAQGAASDAEIRAELAKMKQLESAANDPARMATVPGGDSIVGDDGALPIPREVPEVVQRVIAGANAIANFPYVYGGGHASFVDNAYDCSGSVSYALAAGGLLSAPETSGQLESWGAPGPGKWITVYANAGHTYMYVNIGGAWMLYDTAGRSGVFASRWQPSPVDNAGYVARHWPGY